MKTISLKMPKRIKLLAVACITLLSIAIFWHLPAIFVPKTLLIRHDHRLSSNALEILQNHVCAAECAPWRADTFFNRIMDEIPILNHVWIRNIPTHGKAVVYYKTQTPFVIVNTHSTDAIMTDRGNIYPAEWFSPTAYAGLPTVVTDKPLNIEEKAMLYTFLSRLPLVYLTDYFIRWRDKTYITLQKHSTKHTLIAHAETCITPLTEKQIEFCTARTTQKGDIFIDIRCKKQIVISQKS